MYPICQRRNMDVEAIVAELEAERDRLNRAITALRDRERGPERQVRSGKGGKRHLSAAARKKISQAQKKRWAARKRA
jgi:hypothetical protein